MVTDVARTLVWQRQVCPVYKMPNNGWLWEMTKTINTKLNFFTSAFTLQVDNT